MPVVSYFIALLPCRISTYVGWNISFADLAVPSSKPVDDGTDIFLLARWQMKFLLTNTLSKIELFALLFVCIHAREPLYSKVAVIAWWLQLASAEFLYIFFLFSGILKISILSLNILHLEVFFAVFCHLYIQLHPCLIKDVI